MDIGFVFVVATGGGAWGGYWLDARLGTTPWLFVVGALLGITAGFYHFFSIVLRK
jgi:F0F1-type ATP synthase assembly protein I